MTYPKIGNEIDNLGVTLLEADYRRESVLRSWGRSALEAVLFVLAITALLALCVAASAFING